MSQIKKDVQLWQVIAGVFLFVFVGRMFLPEQNEKSQEPIQAIKSESDSRLTVAETNKKENLHKNDDTTDTAVYVRAKRAVRNMAKDPDSVEFRDLIYAKNTLCGQFNAKNSFGAYTGFTRFISDGRNVLIDGQNDTNKPFAEIWIDICI